jgi:hypothetical protein
MAYSVDTFSGSKTILVEDGTVNTTLDIRLVGKNYAGYGEIQNENFVHMLENFAGVSAPPRPLNGQIWYDNSAKKIKFWDATGLKWRGTGGIEVSQSAPLAAAEGDLWWNTDSEQLFAYNDNTDEWLLIGPQGIEDYEKSRVEPMRVTDTLSVEHVILASYVDGDIVYVVSKDAEFSLGPLSQQQLGGALSFSIIKPGITIANTNSNGATSLESSKVLWGTSSTAVSLTGGVLGQIPYQTAPNITEFLTPNYSTSRKILAQTGTGTTSAAPQWITLPTALPIALASGQILNVPLANGSFPVVTRSGSTINITVN